MAVDWESGRVVVDVGEFLKQFPVEELVSRGILNGGTCLLNYRSVSPLRKLMAERGVSRLEAPGRRWFLTVDGEFENPYSNEARAGRVEELAKPGNVFNEQNTSINPHYAGGIGPEIAEGEEGSTQRSFGLERDLQKALSDNIEQLEPGLEIVDRGTEQTVAAGRIDITAKDTEGCRVIIELKAGPADLRSIGQLLSYMGSIDDEPSRPIRGILVASEFPPNLIMAAKAVPNLSLRVYSFQFSFSER